MDNLPLKTILNNSDLLLIKATNGSYYKLNAESLKTLVGVNDWLTIDVLLSPFQLVPGHRVITDCSNGNITVKLPLNPDVGDEIHLITNGLATHTLTIDRNNETIQNQEQNLTISVDYLRISLIFDGNTWCLNFFESGVSGIHNTIANPDPDANNPNISIGNLKQYDCLGIAEIVTHTLIQRNCTLV